MGWPKKNEEVRLYQERHKDKSYILVQVGNGKNGSGMYDCIANAQAGSSPSLCSTGCDPNWLRNCCRRIQWSNLPQEWKDEFAKKLDLPPVTYNGLWKVGEADVFNLVEFAKKCDGWQSYGYDADTLKAIKTAVTRKLIEINKFHQFRLSTT